MSRFIQCGVLILLFGSLFTTAHGQNASGISARDYYKELYDAGGLDNFADQYVCFRDDDVPTFFIMAKSDGIRDLFEHDGEMKKLTPKMQADLKRGFLFKVTYNKGIPNGMEYLDPDSSGGYREDFDLPSKVPGKTTPLRLSLRVSWQTLRYKIDISEPGKLNILAEDTGKCEVVNDNIRQHGHQN